MESPVLYQVSLAYAFCALIEILPLLRVKDLVIDSVESSTLTTSTSVSASCRVDPLDRNGTLSLESHGDKVSRSTICDWGALKGCPFHMLVVGW